MKYILVIILIYSGGTGTSTAEFDDKAACNLAANHIRKAFAGGYAYCYPKSSVAKEPPDGK